MKNFMMNVMRFFRMKGCSSSSVMSYYDLDMYMWY